jgi:two-component system, NarL family, nitrate/nitrite response regulator NarL
MKSEESMDSKIRVLVIDGSAIHTQLLSDALRRDHGLEVFSCDSVQAAMGSVLERTFDVLVLSANLNEQSYRGLDLLREARASRPQIRAVILFDSSKPEAVLDAFRAGARGVFSRQESLDKLCKCIRCVHSGQIWADSRETSLALDALASAPALHAVDANGLNLLSKRESEIVECVAEGLTNREIAERLRLSRHTIKNSLFRIFDKLGVSNRLELLLMTLSRDSNPQLRFTNFLRTGILQDDCTLEECQQAAEQGSLVAQLLLVQLYSTKNNPTDTLLAYKWHLVVSAQLAQAAKKLKETMSMEQLSQAEAMAADWLKRPGKFPAASIGVGAQVSAIGMDAGGD